MKIFKYQAINKYLIRSLISKKHWCSKLSFLNDPFECYIAGSAASAYKDLISSFCVCCFSQNMHEILMWSHYGDSHKGVCLEWDVEHEKLSDMLIPIIYTNELTFIDNVKSTTAGHFSLNINTNGRFLRQKFKTWEYESEIRFYKISDNLHENGVEADFLGELSAIYFGKHTTKEDIELIKFVTQHYGNVSYYMTELNKDRMKIETISQI